MKVELNIEWLLEKKKMRLSDLEKLVNLSYQQLWNIKQWRTSKVTFETVWELLKAFKCKPNDLFKITKN
jgi:DNA-binding Xre family transcriptional regulator